MIAPPLFCFWLEIKLVILHATCREEEENTETKKLDGPRYVKSSYFNEIYDLLQKETTKYKIYSVLLGSFRCLR